ncbi:MAG: hypothetical protein IJX08_05100, partial [Clostridia bacterium]|nr:hypothetical protein [Clostridia bacterium]
MAYIEKISEERINEIRNKSAYGLPDHPSDAGMSAEQIKKALYAPITDKESSALAEINRVIEEANTQFKKLEEKNAEAGKDGASIYKVGTYRNGDGAYSSDLSTVELPEGRTLQVGDFLLHEDGTLLQVTQIGNEEISDYWLG